MDKINFENSPSTNTPLSAEILNLMQTNIENAINGKTVYSSSTGTTENLSFSSSITNAKKIKIEYKISHGATFTFNKIFDYTADMYAQLDFNMSDNTQNVIFYGAKAIQITNTGIVALTTGREVNTVQMTGGAIGVNVYITKVVAYF